MQSNKNSFQGRGRIRACLNPIRPCVTERNGTRLFMVVRSVPTVGKNPCLGPSRILAFASQISTNDNLLHMPRRNNSMLVRKKCPPPSTVMSISVKQDFICARSVGPFGPSEEKEVHHTFFLFLDNCFSRAAWYLFDVGNQSKYQLIWHQNTIPFGSFQCSLKGVKTRPKSLTPYSYLRGPSGPTELAQTSIV